MGSERIGCDRHTSPAPTERNFRYANSSGGDGYREPQNALGRHEAGAFAFQPLISVITPVFDTPVQRLEEALESVLAQAYESWELLLIDDGSSATDLLEALPALAARDQRIILGKVGKHAGISAASNQALTLARGEWVVVLDHDDVLEPDALFQIAKLLQTQRDAEMTY